jgi:hypothetical protein
MGANLKSDEPGGNLMRILLSTTALALVLGFAAPASAQMCGGGNVGQAGATAQPGATAQSGGMMGMCGGMTGQRIPTAEEQLEGKAAKPQQSGMMCACCRNMAMMRGGQQGGGGGMNMPGMEMPKPQ